MNKKATSNCFVAFVLRSKKKNCQILSVFLAFSFETMYYSHIVSDNREVVV